MTSRTLSTLCTLSPIALVFAGCDKLTPNGQSNTMSLLRGGSEKVCVAPDVTKTLRGLILPKVDGNGTDSDVDKVTREVISGFSISLNLTTLQSADKAVNKAICNTVAKMAAYNGETHSFSITYQISPSADNPGRFVVSGNTDDAANFARDAIGGVVAHQLAAQAQEQEAAQAQQSRQKLLATITPRWLVGSWIQTTANAALCGDGHAMVYRPEHGFSAYQASGRWTLSADTLHVVGQNAAGPMNLEGTITAADPLSFTLAGKDGQSVSFRRCSRDETNIPPLPDVIAPADPGQN